MSDGFTRHQEIRFLERIADATERIAAALEAANAADPVLAIERALAQNAPVARPDAPGATDGAQRRPDIPPDQAWRFR